MGVTATLLSQRNIPNLMLPSREKLSSTVVTLALRDPHRVYQDHRIERGFVQLLLEACQSAKAIATSSEILGGCLLTCPRPRQVIIESLQVIEVVLCFTFILLVQAQRLSLICRRLLNRI